MKIVVDLGEQTLEIQRSPSGDPWFWCKVTSPNGTVQDFWVPFDCADLVGQSFAAAKHLPLVPKSLV